MKYNIDSNEVIKELMKFEIETLHDTGVGKISGGFAKAEVFNHDDNYIDIELKWGIQSDCENNVHIEQYKMNRETLEIE